MRKRIQGKSSSDIKIKFWKSWPGGEDGDFEGEVISTQQHAGLTYYTVEITKILKQNDKLKKENVLHTQWVIPETNII